MNTHINQNRRNAGLAKALNFGGQFKVVERDHMPVEVATELLCTPKARTTNRERKIWNAARTIVFESTLRPIPEEQKTSVWLQSRTWQQIHQSLSRTIQARVKAQIHFKFIVREIGKLSMVPDAKDTPLRRAILERQQAALDIHAAGLDALREALENELTRRESFCASLKEMAPSIAKVLRRSLCGYSRK
jgi:hypothetical protein